MGDQRDPIAAADLIDAGTSLVVAGALGSGKSFFLRAIAEEIGVRGHPPVILRAGMHLSGQPDGMLEYASDERVRRLIDAEHEFDERLIVVIDDAHRMDAASVDVLARAMYRGVAVLVAGIELPRVRSARDADRGTAAAHLIDLWLRGGAERIDLKDLTPSEADHLLTSFPGGVDLDDVTRAAVVSHADGSRILVRELVACAAAATADGRDSFTSLRAVERRSRLGDALHAQVADLGPDHRAALAILGQLPGITYPDACRILPGDTISALVGSSLVHDDRSASRRLFANTLLAREAAHQTPSDVIVDAIEDIARQMAEGNDTWWSAPVAVAIEKLWHSRRARRWTPSMTSAAYRRRVRSDAARWALDHGRPDIALAYANGDDPAAALDRAQANATLQRHPAHLRDVDVAGLDTPSLLRYLTLRLHVFAGMSVREISERVAPPLLDDPAVARSLVLAEVEEAAFDFDAFRATVGAERVFADLEAGPLIRLRAGLVAALCLAYDGESARSKHYFRQVRALLNSPGAASDLGVEERLLALAAELLAAHTTGDVVPDAEARLTDESRRATRKRSSVGIVLAGLSGALLWARMGDADRALRETHAAVRRAANVSVGPCATLIQFAIVRTLAVLGRVEDARRLMEHQIDETGACTALLRHADLLTQSSLFLAEGDTDRALGLAQEALHLSERGHARLLELRDLYQLVALGETDERVLERITTIARETDDDRVGALTGHVTAVATGDPEMTERSPVDRLRIAAPWIPSHTSRFLQAARSEERDARGRAGDTPVDLTRRELEIIGLVAQGLNNREIAAQLYLSVRTVESHVYQARMKVGAGSRRELARHARLAVSDLEQDGRRSVEAR